MRRARITGFIREHAILFLILSTFASHAWTGNPEVEIASGPLYGGQGNIHPNMLLSLSVEFPTAGVAYRGDNGTYNRIYEYVGYFNPSKCYSYNGGNRNLADTGKLSDDGYFHILKDADPATHECGGDSFSGNFMNWATSSAIDMLRYALTGGDRVYDTADATVLQRAFLRDSADNNFYAHNTYFPRRKVTAGGNVSAPNQVTPFNTSTLYVVSCRNRVLFSDTTSGIVGNNADNSKAASSYCTSVFNDKTKGKEETKDKNLGEYLVRVKICDSNEGAARTDLCHKYGSSYKPVGAIQRNAQKLRLAAMGYLMDDSEQRYGGVLRAPMKYVGAKKLDAPNFIETDNDKLEWDPATGVFYANPEDPSDRNSAASYSGVINYLNRFGRSGKYKRFDPVGELYYEGIRYLQGRLPTPEAAKDMTDAMKDGFPVITNWTDPVIASCQKNYIVAIADVNTHWDRYIPGNARTKYGDNLDAHDAERPADAAADKVPDLDVRVWTEKVGKMESDADGTYTNPAPKSDLSDLHLRDTGAGGHGTYYMAGLAYWANTHDIRLDKPIRVKTITIDVDEGGNGQIDDNTRKIQPRKSQLYLAAKYGGFDDRNNDGNPFITLDADGLTTVKHGNSEWDGHGNGVPANYFLAGQPRELIKSIRAVFDNVAASSGTVASVSVSSTRISSDGAFVFQPGFNSSRWSGSLKKLAIALDDTGMVSIAARAAWDAGELLTGTETRAASPKPDARKIYISKVTSDKPPATVEFRWENLDAAQKALLNAFPVDGANDGLGEQRLKYLRGERNLELGHENGMFRARDRVLGDIVNGNPVYVGAPASNVQGPDYQKFYDDRKDRAKVVYVGANDGMLHAFSAEDGVELFAYIPNALMKDLNQLTRPEYVHRPYVDGALTVAEARTNAKWKTVLASGMGGGAQGVFALDVTDPSGFGGGAGAIWEFTDMDDPDMGNVMGAPVIAKFAMPSRDGKSEYRYFVVVSSGLNNHKDDGKKGDGANRFNDDAAGALFLLSLDKNASDKWAQGVNYYKFRVPAKDAGLQNGLSSPALVIDGNGAVRYAYAGDLQGNLWRFDFTGKADWSEVLPGDRTPLFAAKDDQGVRQPITGQPKVVFAPGGGYVVLFGTGKFLEDADAAAGNFKAQSFYGVYDTTRNDYSVGGRSELAPRTLEKNGAGAMKISGNGFSYGSSGNYKKGWYFDFLDSGATGERSVTNPLVANGKLFFNSLIPAKDPCAAGGGRSYSLDTLTGLPPDDESTGFLSRVGLLSSPVRLETEAAEVSGRNAIGRRTARKRHSIANFGTGGAQGTAAPAENGTGSASMPAGRFSWREVANWQELRNAVKK